MNLSAYWAAYHSTLARIRAERPDTFAGLKAILDTFEPLSSGDAFFPSGTDDDLADALHDAGWEIHFNKGTYVYMARHLRTRAKLHYIEGDLYNRTRREVTS